MPVGGAAERYVADVRAVWRAERAVGDATAFSEAAARGLHKLTAYKDEYEVARLLTDPAVKARLSAEVPGGTKQRFLLHPPTLRALGRKKKIAFRRASTKPSSFCNCATPTARW